MSVEAYTGTWEVIAENNSITLLRLRVPGGWLVTVRDTALAVNQTTTLFVANPDGLWGITDDED